MEAKGGKGTYGPVVNARVIQLSKSGFATTTDARSVIEKAIMERAQEAVARISDVQLRNVRRIQILLMA